MLLPTVAEQQAKLGVSAEESKALRLKRQQARFRDRGGAFVPATSNPLVDILLARTVSGESPSKAHPKRVTAKRRSSAKAPQASPTRNARAVTESQAVAGSSKSKLPASGKRKQRAVEPEANAPAKPLPKRRSTAKSKKNPLDPGSDTEQPRPSTSNGKGRRRGNPGSKPKAKPKPKSKSIKPVVEVLASDDDSTLVEVSHRIKSNPKREIGDEDGGETDDDEPIVRKRVMPSKASSSKAATSVKSKRTKEKTLEDNEERTQDRKRPKATAKKRPILPDEEDVAEPPAKKGKAAGSTSKIPDEPESAPRPLKDVRKGETTKASDRGKGKVKNESVRDVVEPVEEDDDERPLERVSKLKKRKTEDNYDNRPRKVVKFSETCPTHSSSQKLKENQSERKRALGAKSNVKDQPDALCEKLATLKGPPQEVLERIKASVARHLRCVDSDPDELDCFS